jgi:serine/threonine-protein kinase RsbW
MEKLTHSFPSDARHLADIRLFLRDACLRAWGPEAGEAIAALELALDEAVSNVILHAYEGQPDRPIELTVETDPEQVSVSVYHEGKGFDPAAVPSPVFDGSRQGGFGLYLMKQTVEEVTFLAEPDGRHGVRLVKRRHPPQTRAREEA